MKFAINTGLFPINVKFETANIAKAGKKAKLVWLFRGKADSNSKCENTKDI
jgi:hypothetical protein